MPAELYLRYAPFCLKVTGELLPGKFFLQPYTLTIKINQFFVPHHNFSLDKNKIFQYYDCILYTTNLLGAKGNGQKEKSGLISFAFGP